MASVVLKSHFDDDIFYSAKVIDVNRKRLNTPFTVLNTRQDINAIPSGFKNHFYEAWKTINIQEVKEAPFNNTIALSLRNKILSANNQALPSEPRIFFLNLKGFDAGTNPFAILNENLLKMLLDSYYLQTNIIAFPIIQKITEVVKNASLCSLYEEYIQKCYDIAETLNTKPIMGVIPAIPQNFIARIVKKYIALGISNFCFDFEGSSLSTYFPHYREFLRTLYLHDKKTFGEKLVHVINMKLPSNMNRNQPFPAEDMLTPAIGADIIGINHTNFGRKELPLTSKQGKGKKKSPVRMNLLDIEQYSYHRVESLDEFKEIFPNALVKPSFSELASVNAQNRTVFSRTFNYCQSNQELSNIHENIINNMSVVQILNQKAGIKDQLATKVRGMKNFVNSKKLDDFFH